jgi:hypothetical protein
VSCNTTLGGNIANLPAGCQACVVTPAPGFVKPPVGQRSIVKFASPVTDPQGLTGNCAFGMRHAFFPADIACPVEEFDSNAVPAGLCVGAIVNL